MGMISAGFALLFQFAFMAAIIGVVFFVAMKQRQRRDREWARFAREHGLEFTPPGFLEKPEIRGFFEGQPVRVHTVSRSAGKSQVTYTVARSAIQAPVPEGFTVSREGLDTAIVKFFGGQDIEIGQPDLDSKLRIRGSSPDEIRRALSYPTVRQALGGLLSAHRYSRVQRGQVFVEQRGTKYSADLERMLRVSVALSVALTRAFSQPWKQLADKHGLDLDELGLATVIDGHIEGIGPDGVRVSIKADRKPGRVGTRMRISLPRPLPDKLSLSLRGRDEPGGVGLGDPVLDSMIRADAADPDAGRRLLAAAAAEDDLHGLLLGVVHGHPGSRVTSREIVLDDPKVDPVLAGEWLDQCLALAAALGRAVERADLSGAVARGRGHLAEREAAAFDPPAPPRTPQPD